MHGLSHFYLQGKQMLDFKALFTVVATATVPFSSVFTRPSIFILPLAPPPPEEVFFSSMLPCLTFFICLLYSAPLRVAEVCKVVNEGVGDDSLSGLSRGSRLLCSCTASSVAVCSFVRSSESSGVACALPVWLSPFASFSVARGVLFRWILISVVRLAGRGGRVPVFSLLSKVMLFEIFSLFVS